MNADALKKEAALKAAALVQDGMIVGLGSGSTARHAIDELGRLYLAGALANIRGVPTSEESARQATALGIPLITLPEDGLDIAVDGMDEVTGDLHAIKGLGGALTREKIVAQNARRFILIGDDRKRVGHLGQKAPVPVEVVTFGWQATARQLAALECGVSPRMQSRDSNEFFITDNHNYVLDCRFNGPFDPHEIAMRIKTITGVLEHGLFLNMAERAFVASQDGVLELTKGGTA
jgi:ribose 5-phosphate isomerase A